MASVGIEATNVSGGMMSWLHEGFEAEFGQSNGSDVEFTKLTQHRRFSASLKSCSLHRYAIDTEFIVSATGFPALALVQLGWETEISCSSIRRRLCPLRSCSNLMWRRSPHAAQQDLVFSPRGRRDPRTLFDTQIAGVRRIRHTFLRRSHPEPARQR